MTGGATLLAPRKMARKPASRSSVSQPNEYHVCPTFTNERYNSHITNQIAMLTGVPKRSDSPATASSEQATPIQANTIAKPSE